MQQYQNTYTGVCINWGEDEPHILTCYGPHQFNVWQTDGAKAYRDGEDIWALYNFCRESLEKLYPGCIYPVPMDEVDADVMRAFSEMQERYRENLTNE